MNFVSDANATQLFTKVGNTIDGTNGLVKDTVGWTGKNLLENKASSTTKNGVTFTVNSDGSVTVSTVAGGATARADFEIGQNDFGSTNFATYSNPPSANGYTISSGQNGTKADANEGVSTFYTSYNGTYKVVNITVLSGQIITTPITFYPMIRDARITDATYEPYHESVDECKYNRSEANVLGAKNLLDNTYNLKKVASGTQLDNVTVTRRLDGAVVLNGSTSGTGNQGYVEVFKTTNFQFDGMILSGKNGNAITAAKLGLWDETASRGLWLETAEEAEISGMNGHTVRVTLNIYGGATFTNMVFLPMIRLSTDPDNTYATYAMTNRELTKNKFGLISTLISSDNLNNCTKTGLYMWGNSTPVNSPENTTYGAMNVYNFGDFITQEIVRPTGGSAQIYMRRYQNDEWGAWIKIVSTTTI